MSAGRTCLGFVALVAGCATAPDSPPAGPTTAQVLDASRPADWRRPDPERTLYLELDTGRVVIELAEDFAPRHAANIRSLARGGYFDGLPILRVQENYVVQWGDPTGDKPLGGAAKKLPAEFDRPTEGLPFAALPDGDVYAPTTGFTRDFPVGRDGERTWLAHCYGMVGAGRGMDPGSSGAELYVVTGHAPRHLDRNITLVGRVLRGMEQLTTLPRGTGPLGFYEREEQYVPIRRVRVAADLPESGRTPLDVMRTDTPAFQDHVASRRWRREEWFLHPVGRVELCNVPLVVRESRRPTE